MRIHRVSLLLLSAILNFTTINGHLYFAVPPVHGVNLYGNQVPYRPTMANQPIGDKLLDLLKEKLRNQVIIQNINRRSGVSNIQESALKGLRKLLPTVWQNNEEKVLSANPQLLERLREQHFGKIALQHGLDIDKNQYILPNVGQYGAYPIFDLLPQLNQQNRGQFVMQNVNRRLANFFKRNPVAILGPNLLQREQFVLQNIGRRNVPSPSIADFLERLTQNNRGQLVVQSVGRPTPAYLHRQPEEPFFLQNNNDKSVPVGLQRYNHEQMMHNPCLQCLHPEINYFNPFVELETLQHRERPTSHSIGHRPSRINFANIEALRLQQPGQTVIQNVKGLSKHENSYLNSLLEELKGHSDQETINPNKDRYQNDLPSVYP